VEPILEAPIASGLERSNLLLQWLGSRQFKLLALAVLGVVAVLAVNMSLDAHRHKASAYGIVDPSSAALRVANRSSDFAITRVAIGDASINVADELVYQEIGPGAQAVIEIPPGTYVIDISYVEIKQAAEWVPRGLLNGSFRVSPGQAAICHLQGGRTSPDRPILIPPELDFK
jgi:hypothetical protein